VVSFSIAFLVNQAVLISATGLFAIHPNISQIFSMIAYTIVFYGLSKKFVFVPAPEDTKQR
jgi:putative flippase GtrA